MLRRIDFFQKHEIWGSGKHIFFIILCEFKVRSSQKCTRCFGYFLDEKTVLRLYNLLDAQDKKVRQVSTKYAAS